VASRLTKVINSAGSSTWPTNEYCRTFSCRPQWLPVRLATATPSPLPSSPLPPAPTTWLTNENCESRGFPIEVIIVHELDADYMLHGPSKLESAPFRLRRVLAAAAATGVSYHCAILALATTQLISALVAAAALAAAGVALRTAVVEFR